MSKKDFIALADAIMFHNRTATNYGTGTAFTQDQLAMLADFCKAQNYDFKRDRWFDYISGKCGKSGGAIKKAA